MQIGTILKKRGVKICLGVAAAVVVLLLLLPVAAKYYLADWLEKNGADRATIETLRLNPFRARITLNGMAVQAAGRSVFSNVRGVVDFNLLSLFHRDVHLQRAEYRNLAIDLEQYDDGRWRIGSYTMAAGAPEAKTKEEGIPWVFTADRLILTDCLVRLKTTELDLTLTVDKAELAGFTTRESDRPGSFSLHGRLGEGLVAVELEQVQLSPDVRIAGDISIAGFPLAELGRLLRDGLPVFAGKAGLAGSGSFVHSQQKGIQAEYKGDIEVVESDIGNDDFALASRSLKWQGRVRFSGPAQGPIAVATDGELAAGGLHLQVPAAELVMREELLRLQGKTNIVVGDTVQVKNEGSLLLEGIAVTSPPFKASGERLAWQGEVLYDPAHGGNGRLADSEGSLQLAGFEVTGGEAEHFAVAGTNLSWRGKIGYGKAESATPAVELDGVLVGDGLRTDLAGPRYRFMQRQLEMRTKSAIAFGETIETTSHSSLAAEEVVFLQEDRAMLACARLTVSGLEARAGGIFALEELTATALRAAIPGTPPLTADISDLHLTGWTTDAGFAWSGQALALDQTTIRSVQSGEELMRLARLSAEDMHGKSDIRAGSLQVEDFAFLAASPDSADQPAVTFGRAGLDGIGWSREAGLGGGTLRVDALSAVVIMEKDGTLAVRQKLAAMHPPEAGATPDRNTPEASPPAAGASGGTVKLAGLEVTGKSQVLFTDNSLAKPFTTELALSRLTIGPLDSSRPEEKIDVLLEGQLEQRAPLHVAGTVSPFLAEPAAKLQLNLKNYPLADLSSYTVKSVGTAFASGQLRLESSIKLADDALDMDNKVLLQKLETETVAPELAKELNNRLPVPLDSALALLRDGNRDISLDIPIRGPMSELDVGIADVLITALGKAIVPAASGYLMYALGPYGALAYVGLKVGEKMLEVKLPPVVFLPQATAINTEHEKYLERVGRILKDRPETDMQLCPIVPAWEILGEEERAAAGETVNVGEKDEERLLALGQQRAEAIRDYLVKSAAVAKDRLLICTTRIATEKKVQPSVLLQI